MNIKCEDRDRIFEDGTPAEWAALEAHSANCAICAEELRAWKALSVAAKELRDYSDTPSLWPQIERSLTEEAAAKKQRSGTMGLALAWIRPLSGMANRRGCCPGTGLDSFRRLGLFASHWACTRAGPVASEESSAGRGGARAIRLRASDRQAGCGSQTALENPATPLQASYREKLLVLDSAINDLRAQAGMNPSNAHLRQQLLAMYQEKQQTLEDILEEKR